MKIKYKTNIFNIKYEISILILNLDHRNLCKSKKNIIIKFICMA